MRNTKKKSNMFKVILLFVLTFSLIINLIIAFVYKQDIKKVIKNKFIEVGLISKANVSEIKPFAYYASYTSIEDINGMKDPQSPMQIPEYLIISPGEYEVNNIVYDLSNEGLYRFVHPLHENKQRVVFENDIDVLLSSISWIVSHGNSDSKLSNDELSKKALDDKIYVACKTISIWTKHVLDSFDIQSRIVSCVTLEEYNYYSDGHVMLEIFDNKYNKWVLYDLDMNAKFMSDGIPLSLLEFNDQLNMNREYQIVTISQDIRLDISDFKSTYPPYSWGFVTERTVNVLPDWYRRILQCVFIWDENTTARFYFNKEFLDEVVNSNRDLIFLEYEEFIERFY